MTRKVASILATIAFVLGLSACGAQGGEGSGEMETWGPQDREMYTWDQTVDYATFNCYTDNPEIGDERNFVRLRKADSNDDFEDNIDIEPGQEYEAFIWFDNGANPSLNTEDDGIGIAKNARLLLEAPKSVPAGHAAAIKATISADNTKPLKIWDTAFGNADEGVTLTYVPNSAVIHLNDPGTYDEAKGGYYDAKGHETVQGKILSEEALFGRDGYGGAKLAYWNDNWGYVPAGTQYCGYITCRFSVAPADAS